MAAKQNGMNFVLNTNVDISKEAKEQVKEENEFYGNKVALADDSLSFQEDDTLVSELLKDDEPDEADNASNAEKVTEKDEDVNSVDRASSSNADNFTPAVLEVNDDVVKYASFSTSDERNNNDNIPTSSYKMKVLEVNAELSKHNLPANLLIAVSLEGSSQNSEGCRSTDSANKFEVENGGCVEGFAPGETSRIMRNVIVISIAFMVHFTAFCGTSNLQSSINAVGGLGTASLMSIYVSMMISTIFLPVIVIRWLGCKWTMAASLICYVPYILAQVYSRFYTLIPAGFLDGLGAGPLWCAKCIYLNVVAEMYSKITGVSVDTVLVRFFGIFFMIYELSEVWGNLISSAVLSVGKTNVNMSIDLGEVCGVNFYPGSELLANPNLERPPEGKIWTFVLIYLGCMVLASLIITFGVDSLKRYNEAGRVGSGAGMTGVQLLIVTIKLLKDPKQLLLLPITAWLGVGQVFRGSDFTIAYVSCAWGISNIGYVMIVYGVTHSVSAILTGYIVKLTGRLFTVCSAMILQIGIIITLLIWKPEPADSIMFFSISALCGMLFPGNEEAAYSNYRMWRSVGFISAYAYNPYLCTSTKIYILLALLIIGMGGYIIIEWGEMNKKRDNCKK
ncbi:UNC93-like protein isoform X2 [Zootermopsis nevadensis]|uniref:UNC93-like protein isoform X2 n=1 Tax=Zootermopsis nevadensis TaxID=136037 RepID=UPI000B8EB58A|nr:UNC93-like protein isoform X2 [Zootermopsis nevadensis]